MRNATRIKSLIRFSLFTLFGSMTINNPVLAKSTNINVFAIPSDPIIKLVEKTSAELKQQGMSSFYDKGFAVHTTLYLTQFPEGSENAIKQAIEKLAKQHQPFALEANGFSVSQSNWVFVDLIRSKQLQNLADKVTMAIAPLRDTTAPVPTWVSSYPNKLEAFKRYGSPNVFQNFQPHLTLLANEQNKNLASFNIKMQTKPPKALGKVIGIGIGLSDQWGQQKEVIAKYYFHDVKK